jgi:nanoRNase/pAp phosphatase (c-di-AMP/oligoRNAs hydrolase)
VDLTEVARLFGGGGHAYASGARLPYAVKDDAAYERALADMDARLAGYLPG